MKTMEVGAVSEDLSDWAVAWEYRTTVPAGPGTNPLGQNGAMRVNPQFLEDLSPTRTLLIMAIGGKA